MPDTIKFLVVLGVVVALIYGGVLVLSKNPPEQTQIIRPLPHDKLRQR